MSDEGHIHIYVPDLEQPNHGRCVCGRDGTPSSYDWWKTAIAQAASLAEARRRAEIAEVDTRQLEAVDAALPEWKGTGRGRVETISRLREALSALVNACEDAFETPEEAADWARTGDMRGYLDTALAALRAPGPAGSATPDGPDGGRICCAADGWPGMKHAAGCPADRRMP